MLKTNRCYLYRYAHDYYINIINFIYIINIKSYFNQHRNRNIVNLEYFHKSRVYKDEINKYKNIFFKFLLRILNKIIEKTKLTVKIITVKISKNRNKGDEKFFSLE